MLCVSPAALLRVVESSSRTRVMNPSVPTASSSSVIVAPSPPSFFSATVVVRRRRATHRPRRLVDRPGCSVLSPPSPNNLTVATLLPVAARYLLVAVVALVVV